MTAKELLKLYKPFIIQKIHKWRSMKTKSNISYSDKPQSPKLEDEKVHKTKEEIPRETSARDSQNIV